MENKTEDNSKQDVMVSNLPLLFSDSKPTSITSMTVEDLQYFIPFLIKCILGCEPSGWARYTRFKWWPTDVPWSPIILTKKYQTNNWRSKLTTLVKNCYNYNGCTYLLQFSAKLQTLTGGYKFEDNWDGTTSMYDSTNGKLLVTFQNENMIYDKGFRQQSSASRPMLLPRLNSPTSPTKINAGTSNTMGIEAPTAAKMVEPPVNDIYLCDYCGADFSSLSAIKAHEAKCMADKALEAQSNSSNSFTELETQDMDEAQFLWYLSLSSRSQALPPPNVTPAKVRPVVRRTCTLSDKRFTTIPFSSNLGQSFFKAIRLSPTASELLVSRYERLCAAKPILPRSDLLAGEHTHQPIPSGTTSNRFRSVTFKRKDEWTHSYSFNRADRRERMETIATGLNKRSRQLLQRCEVIRVTMVKLKPEEIEIWTRPKPKPKHPPHLLQPWLQRNQGCIANLPASCTISLAPADSLKTYLRHQQATSPSLTMSRHIPKNLLTAKSQARAPPGLLPLITSTWSMQTMQSAKSKPTKNQFILPDLIPVVNRHSRTRSTDPVVIRMPSMSSPKSVAASSRIQTTSSGNTADIVDLCSSEEEVDNDEPGKRNVLPKTLVLPPGISITKVKKTSSGAQYQLPNSRSSETPFEKNNNRSRSVSQWLATATTVPLPVLTFMGQPQAVVKKELSRSDVALGVSSGDSSLPIVTPLKLGKLPAEKREQMKQSLLKIQKKEKKSPSSNNEISSPPTPINTIQTTSDGIDPLQLSPLPRSSASPKNNLSPFLSEERKELKNKRLITDILFSNQRSTGRKREKEPDFHSCDEEDSLSDCPNKKARKLDQSPSSICLVPQGQLVRGSDNYSSIIEVDLGGPDNEISDSSRANSFGSLTPESKLPKKRTLQRNELMFLLNDECKELRRKGLEDLSFEANSNQRITRCRTKSQPLMSGKR